MHIAPALLLAAILASPLGACDRTSAPVLDTPQTAPAAAGQPGAPLLTPNPRPLDLAEVFKIPPQRVQTSSTSWYIACTWDRVYFAPGSADILPETVACLRTKLELLRGTNWFVIGAADHQEAETEEARIDLMRRRGENVVAVIRALGVTTSSTNPVLTGEYGYLIRDGVLSAPDYHQEFRVVIIY